MLPPQCETLCKESDCKKIAADPHMKHAETRRWLMRIAGAIDGWPLRQEDGRGWAAHETTPTTAVATLVYRDIAGADDRRAVIAALPRVLSEDWTEAAHQIREAAQRLWSSAAERPQSAHTRMLNANCGSRSPKRFGRSRSTTSKQVFQPPCHSLGEFDRRWATVDQAADSAFSSIRRSCNCY